jgi:MFS family permease
VLVLGISILGDIAGGIWIQRKGIRGTLAPAVLLVAECLANSAGLAPFISLLILCAERPLRAMLFAFVSGVMNLGGTLPGTISGFLQLAIGYPALFFVLTIGCLPLLLIIPRLPLNSLESRREGQETIGSSRQCDPTARDE